MSEVRSKLVYPPIHYRSVADLNGAVRRGAATLPRDIDLIVGIPRSGLLAANLLALHLNLPLANVESFLAGQCLGGGRRLNGPAAGSKKEFRKVLVLDDSVNSGSSIRAARDQIGSGPGGCEIIYGCVYSQEGTIIPGLDLCFETCPTPRIFEWNLFHHFFLEKTCLDIDGVLCRDPLPQENDDGPAYRNFLKTAPTLFLPTIEVDSLVTCRLEKYRPETEAWLERHGIRYRELIMWDLPSQAARQASGGHGKFKAGVFRRSNNILFVESSLAQARVIARESGKSVFCVESQTMITPGQGDLLRAATKHAPMWFVTRLMSKIRRMAKGITGNGAVTSAPPAEISGK